MLVASLIFETETGTSELATVPFPSWPSSPYPQQLTRPVARMAQYPAPSLASAIALVIPLTDTGTFESAESVPSPVVPFPSSPNAL
jgi:hypothetical protein